MNSLHRTIAMATLALLAPLFLYSQLNNSGSERAYVKQSSHDDGLALEGYDPVSYFQGNPLKGTENLHATYRGLTYRFSNAGNLARFNENPEKYEPAYGGWCGFMMFRGKRVQPEPENYQIVNGKLVLFLKGFFGDGKKLWNKAIDKHGEQMIIGTADKAWESFLQQADK